MIRQQGKAGEVAHLILLVIQNGNPHKKSFSVALARTAILPE